jgi:hypothetical protein
MGAGQTSKARILYLRTGSGFIKYFRERKLILMVCNDESSHVDYEIDPSPSP